MERWHCIDKRQLKLYALDFDDLLMKAVELFRNSKDTLGKYHSRYLHIMVDEFQDTNLVQYELIKKLGGKKRNICVVGDPDQSIYSWRFADLRNILSFEKDFPKAKLVLLEQNYRSTKSILETASHVISTNQMRKPKELWTDNEEGELTNVVETYTEQEEAQFVVSEVEKLAKEDRAKLGDCAVMYRTNARKLFSASEIALVALISSCMTAPCHIHICIKFQLTFVNAMPPFHPYPANVIIG
ncbi:unnamed protein product [marine sediment metagenome]|uniref:DNA 3'-5' helicase n=1 Tax=marine sediment metagenome TaxID=412755 RepID=X1HM45_9ZZZZ